MTKDVKTVRIEKSAERRNIDVDLQLVSEEGDHVGPVTARVFNEVLGDRASVLGVQLGLSVSTELGPDRGENVRHRQGAYGSHGSIGTPHRRSNLSRCRIHARMQQEKGGQTEQDRLGGNHGHEPHGGLEQDPLRSRRSLQHLRRLALPALPRFLKKLRSPVSTPSPYPWSPPDEQVSHRGASVDTERTRERIRG